MVDIIVGSVLGCSLSLSPGHPGISTGVNDDQSRPDRRGFEDLEPDQEGDRNNRQHDLRQHHRRAVEGRQGRAAGLRELPDSSPELSEGSESQNRVARGRSADARAVLQGRDATADEIAGAMELVTLATSILSVEYRAEGFNVGLNQGRVAGAGILDHLHVHVVPRWNGDTNFMPVVGDVRVHPEPLEASYERLKGRLVG